MDKNNSYPSNLKQEKTICEKLRRAIQPTSPFWTIRFSSQQIHDDGDAVHTPSRSPKVSLIARTPLSDRYASMPKQTSRRDHGAAVVATAISPLHDRCPRILKPSDDVVPVIFRQSEDQPNGAARKVSQKLSVAPNSEHLSPKLPSPTNLTQAKPKPAVGIVHSKPTVVPIHGLENQAPTMFHVGENSSFAEKMDGMFTEYIDRAGRKIRTPTNLGIRKASMRHDSFNDKVSEFINRAKNKFHSTPSSVETSFKEEAGSNEKRLK